MLSATKKLKSLLEKEYNVLYRFILKAGGGGRLDMFLFFFKIRFRPVRLGDGMASSQTKVVCPNFVILGLRTL